MNSPNHPATPASYRAFLVFFSTQQISLLGSSIAQFALVWWVTVTTESAFYLGLTAMLGFGSTMVTIPFAGVLVDRWSRKKILAAVDGSEAFVSLILVYLFLVGQANIIHVIIIATLRGIFQGFHDPAIQAIIPIMVPREQLTTVNSIGYLGNGIIFLIGPLVGAFFIYLFGLDQIYYIMAIDSITFLIAVLPLIAITIPSVRPTAPTLKPSFRSEFWAGITFIKENRGLLSLLSAFTTANFFATPLFILLPLVIDSPRLFNATALELSWVLFAQALGTILGSIVTPKLRIKNNAKGVFYGLSLNYTGVLSATAAIMNQNLPALIISSLIEGISLPLANISSQNIWQTAVPLDLQGRVYSVRRFIAQITSPIAMFSSGVLGEVIFEEYVIGSFASLGLIFLLYLWFLTKLPQVEEIVGASSTKSAQTIPADN